MNHHRTTTIARPTTALAHWEHEYRNPAADIYELRSQLRDGTIDFARFEMSDR